VQKRIPREPFANYINTTNGYSAKIPTSETTTTKKFKGKEIIKQKLF
jgi:hypothetical protein